jgi:hypothetical protein
MALLVGLGCTTLLRQAARLPGLRLGEKSLQITGVIVFGLLLGLPLTSFSYPKQYEAFAGGLKKRVIGLRITWVLLSPVDDSLQWEIFEQLVEEINPEGFKFSKGVLVRVSGLWEKQINKQPTPEGPGQ